jgi:hypothetical protein
MTKLILLTLSTVWLSGSVFADELSVEDLTQCHHYSSLATQYHIAKQQGQTLEQVLSNTQNENEKRLATKVFEDINGSYHVSEMRKVLFQQCAKSFATYRANELRS